MAYNCFCQHSCTSYFKWYCKRIMYVPLFMENFQQLRKFWVPDISVDVESKCHKFDFEMFKLCHTNCKVRFVKEKNISSCYVLVRKLYRIIWIEHSFE